MIVRGKDKLVWKKKTQNIVGRLSNILKSSSTAYFCWESGFKMLIPVLLGRIMAAALNINIQHQPQFIFWFHKSSNICTNDIYKIFLKIFRNGIAQSCCIHIFANPSILFLSRIQRGNILRKTFNLIFSFFQANQVQILIPPPADWDQRPLIEEVFVWEGASRL